jgi:hypothetical protein
MLQIQMPLLTADIVLSGNLFLFLLALSPSFINLFFLVLEQSFTASLSGLMATDGATTESCGDTSCSTFSLLSSLCTFSGNPSVNLLYL